MTDASTDSLEQASPVRPTPTAAREDYPRWKMLCIGFGAVLFLAGLSLRLFGDPVEQSATALAAPTESSSFVDAGAGAEEPVGEAAMPWSSGLMTLGFSFFVGFAMGTLLRIFLRLSVIFAGLVFLALMGLQHVELITVNWVAMDEAFQGLSSRIADDFGELRTIVTGRLPQAGLAVLGLVTGFKRR